LKKIQKIIKKIMEDMRPATPVLFVL